MNEGKIKGVGDREGKLRMRGRENDHEGGDQSREIGRGYSTLVRGDKYEGEGGDPKWKSRRETGRWGRGGGRERLTVREEGGETKKGGISKWGIECLEEKGTESDGVLGDEDQNGRSETQIARGGEV